MMKRLLQRLDFYGNVRAIPRPFVRRDPHVIDIGICAPHGELLACISFERHKA
jgi:hypothetical protein